MGYPIALRARSLLSLSLLLLPATLLAENEGFGTWLKSSPGAGGDINDIAISPSEPDVMFIGTNDGVFRSLDGGVSFEQASGSDSDTALSYSQIRSIVIDPANPLSVSVASYFGIDKSVDGGRTWIAAQGLPSPGDVNAIAASPLAPRTLYAASDDHGLFKSTDAGFNWQVVSTGLSGPRDWATIAVAPSNPQIVYAGRSDSDAATPDIAISIDGGETWEERFVAPPDGFNHFEPSTIAVHPTDPNIVYVGSYLSGDSSVIARSTDGASTWSYLAIDNNGSRVSDIEISAADPSVIFVARGSGAVISFDSGASWAPVESPESVNNRFSVPSVAAFRPDDSNTVFFGSRSGGGLAKSEDGGATSRPIAAGLDFAGVVDIDFAPEDSNIAIASLDNFGLVRSVDGGKSWQPLIEDASGTPLSFASNVSIEASPTTPGKWFAATTQRLFVSTDNGETWAPSNAEGALNEPASASRPGLAIDPSNDDRIFLAGSSSAEGLAFSEDGGATWQLSSVPNGADGIDVAMNASAAFLSTRLYGVFRSQDGGATWQELNTGLTSTDRYEQIVVDPHVAGRVFLTTWSRKVFRSEDNGDSWQELSDIDNVAELLTFDRYTPNRVVALGTYGYLGVSNDGGDSWFVDTRFINGRPPRNISPITSAAAISSTGEIIAGTVSNGIYSKHVDGLFRSAFNQTAAPQAGFSISSIDSALTACAGDDLGTLSLQSTSINGFPHPIELEAIGSEALSVTIEPSIILPGETATLGGTVNAGADAGMHSVTLTGTAVADDGALLTDALGVIVNVSTETPSFPEITSPAPNATDVDPTAAEFAWAAQQGAMSYTFEIATDSAFTDVVVTRATPDTSTLVTGLDPATTYFARVSAGNVCGVGAVSPAVEFTTSSPTLLCSTPAADWTGSDTGLVVEDTINVGDALQIDNLKVSIDLPHSWVSDLRISLLQESTGTSITLLDGECGGSDDIQVTLSDAAETAVGAACQDSAPVIQGLRAPVEPLSTFNASNAAGNWTLQVEDTYSGDSGSLVEWCLIIN